MEDAEMVYYRDPASGQVFAYYVSDIESGATVPPEAYIQLTPEEVNELLNPTPTTEQLAQLAQFEVSRQFRDIYDPQVSRSLRAKRMAGTPEQATAADVRTRALDEYAEALLAVDTQSDYPHTITWPDIPS